MSFDPDKYTNNQDTQEKLKKPDAQGHTGIQNALHMLAKGLPFTLGTTGAVLSSPGLVTGAVGLGLGSGAGHAAQKFIDQALGYEKPDLKADVKDVFESATRDATVGLGTGVALQTAGKMVGPLTKSKEAIQNWLLGGEAGEPARAAAERAGAFNAGTSPRGTVTAIEKGMDRTGTQYQQIIKLLKQQGIVGADADQMAQAYMDRLEEVAPNTMNPAVRKVYSDAANEMKIKGPGRLDLEQQESLKRSSQGMAKSDYAKQEPSEVGRAREDVAAMQRKSVENEIETQVWGRQMQPAIVDSQTGRVYTGHSHADILDQLPPHVQEKLLSDSEDPLLQSGFISPTGEFIDSTTMGRLTGARSSVDVAQLPPARTQTLAGSGRVKGKFSANGVLRTGKGSGPTMMDEGATPLGTDGELTLHDPIPPGEPTPEWVREQQGRKPGWVDPWQRTGRSTPTPLGNSGLARTRDILRPGSGRPPSAYNPGTQDADLITSDVEKAAQDFVPVKREYGALAEARKGAQAHEEESPDWISNLLLTHAMLHPSQMLRVGAAVGAKRLLASRVPTTAASLLRSGAGAAGALGENAERMGPALSLWGTEDKPDVAAIVQALMQKKQDLAAPPQEQPSTFNPEIYMSGVGR